ncbi:N-acetylglucosaminyl transferase component-domain-containing protein [Boeremia exigua]|uniref:N-acetylglucosaminyl transferase component-domain-containing protein n=1 Tax=Boeremia exigua TaxID=749465 RepID=UPI001E8D49CA|nr:N-acetylglucosaminyl transferase component-domain-containing protein [Boeremia exigua]KAH6637614.1 N-acetylglucosaminyl transferase component-domain-containing protein [Boeremia exigua]
MVAHNGLMRIFWPSDAPTDSLPGVLVGFRNSQLDIFVVSVLQEVEPRQVENALVVGTLLRYSPHDIKELFSRCGHSSLCVLGDVNPKSPPSYFNENFLTAYTDPASRLPRWHCCSDVFSTIQVVVYDRPDPIRMQYLSLTPIALALGDKRISERWDTAIAQHEADEEKRMKKKAMLVEKLKLHKVVAHPRTRKEAALPTLIEQVNCSSELDSLIQQNIGMIGRRMKRALSVSERVVESANNLWDYMYECLWYLLTVWVWPIAAQFFICGLMAQRITAEYILRVLDWRMKPDAPALKDISATAQQIDIRLQQFCYWPIQYLTLRKRKASWGSITNSHPEYIRFYNSLWLVANDVIMGIALGSYIIENSSSVAAQIDTIFSTWSIEGLRRMISWLTGWPPPGGLKLNTELAAFLGDLFLWVIEYWSGVMSLLRPQLPALIQVIGLSAFAGATMPISLFSDIVSLLTLHIYSFYIASARIFHWQLTIIISLFHLFRGKKRNILRNRIDSCDYDLDQLLLGTILFTLQFFLLPTIFVFYLTFASARVAVIALKAGLEIGLACLNHFPLFAVMLRLKDSRRLPGGICFDLHDPQHGKLNPQDGLNSVATAYIHLKSVPLSLGAMFQSYFELGTRIRKHYLSPSVFLSLASGQFVPPIHRRNLYSLQYSMLPAERVGIGELWRQLTARAEKQAYNSNAHARMPSFEGVINGRKRRVHK